MVNNEMLGNVHGIYGVTDQRTFRIFSEPTPVTETGSIVVLGRRGFGVRRGLLYGRATMRPRHRGKR